jgi:hypothetical protein
MKVLNVNSALALTPNISMRTMGPVFEVLLGPRILWGHDPQFVAKPVQRLMDKKISYSVFSSMLKTE